jgi:hypothetical protein
MFWVVQSNLFSAYNYERLLSTLERLALTYSVHRVVPFEGTIDPEPSPPDDRVIVMGSFSLARLAAQRGWRPGSFMANLDFEIQRAHWGELMLNHDARVSRFAEIPEQTAPFFIRPVLDTKSFTGAVMEWPKFEAWRGKVLSLASDRAAITAETSVMICSEKEILNETRTWIVDGRVITASGYQFGIHTEYCTPEEVHPDILRFAERCAAAWSPDRAYVLDVALTPEGFRILEVNNLNSAGWYRCDLNRLVIALEEMDL